MLHIGKCEYLYGQEQTISDNVMKKLENYFNKEGELFVRYDSILSHLLYELDGYDDTTNDFRCELRKSAAVICLMLDGKHKHGELKIYKYQEIIDIIYAYMDKFKQAGFLENNTTIDSSIENNMEKYANKWKYSFYNGTKVLKKKKITPDLATKSIILMLYARDYFNIKSILILRNYVMNTEIAKIHLNTEKFNINPGNDLKGLIFSDYGLIEKILALYGSLRSNLSIFITDIPLEENGELIKDNFDYICMILYARNIISLIIFIIECDSTGYFENEKIDKILLKVYRTFSMIILNSVYRSLSMFEFTLFSNLQILNDICAYSYLITPRNKLDDASKISSAIAGDAGHKNHDDIINKIIKRVNTKLDKGCKDTHPQMLKYFKNSKEFSHHFNERGFERAFKKALIETYRQRNLPIIGINGAGVSRSSKK